MRSGALPYVFSLSPQSCTKFGLTQKNVSTGDSYAVTAMDFDSSSLVRLQ